MDGAAKKKKNKKKAAVKKDGDRQKTQLCPLKTKPNSYIRKDCGREPATALQQLFGSIRALLDSSPPMQLYFARLNSSGRTAPSFCTIVAPYLGAVGAHSSLLVCEGACATVESDVRESDGGDAETRRRRANHRDGNGWHHKKNKNKFPPN